MDVPLEALRNKLYTVAIICALPLETSACSLILDVRHGPPRTRSPNDSNSYLLGKIGEHNVVMTWLPHGVYGTNSAAATVTNLLSSFPCVEFGLFVGIGGGIPSQRHDIRLGDVVVGKPEGTSSGVIQWDLGKAEKGGVFRRTGCLNKPPVILLKATAGLEAHGASKISEYIAEIYDRNPDSREQFLFPGPDNDILFKSDYEHPSDTPTCKDCCQSNAIFRAPRKTQDPIVHYGTIASGNQVIKDAVVRDQLGHDLGAICLEMESAGILDNLGCLTIRGISDYSDTHKNKSWQPYAALTASAYAKELLYSILPVTERDSYQKFINRLPRAKGASFDSIFLENEPKCLPNTRVDLLKEVGDWIKGKNSKKVFWLHGQAGTGKSTIARTIARDYNHILGANFFFKRGESDREQITKLCSTLTIDLVHYLPQMRGAVSNTIESDPHISERGLKEQFKKLINVPISYVRAKTSQTILIIIDALDECSCDDNHTPLLIQELAGIKSPEPLSIRIFLTSRYESSITSGFKRLPDGSFEDLDLRDIDSPTIDHDISLLFRSEFSRIQESHLCQDEDEEDRLPIDWPGSRKINRLVKMTAPWFIAASTVCSFVAEPRRDPRTQLEIILASPAQGLSVLGRIYKQVIGQILLDTEKEYLSGRIIADFKAIMGTIIVLESPLSRSSLSNLLGMKKPRVSTILRSLNSILSIPSEPSQPIRIFHTSLRDFLMNEVESERFWIDEREAHHKLFRMCIRLLSNTLKEDICDLKSPSVHANSIHYSIVEKYISPETAYACRHWTHHFVLGYMQKEDEDVIYDFLKGNLLYWLETASIVRHIPQTIKSIAQLERITHKGSDLSTFLHDARQFAQQYRSTIMQYPLQIYSSCVLFAPEESIVRRTFSHLYPAWIQRISPMEPSWNELVSHIEKVSPTSTSFAFSPSGKQFALQSSNGKIGLWDTTTGTQIRTLRARGLFERLILKGIAFLPGGSQMVTLSLNKSLGIWDIPAGTLRHTFTDGRFDTHYLSMRSRKMVLAPSGMMLAVSGRPGEIELENFLTGERKILQTPKCLVQEIVFSADTSRLAALTSDGIITTWIAKSGSILRTYESDKTCDATTKIAISSHNELLATASKLTPGITLWDINGPNRIDLDGLWIKSLAFSPDGQYLVVCPINNQITWIKTADTTAFGTPDTKPIISTSIQEIAGSISHLVFSPDGRYLARLLHTTLTILDTKKVIKKRQELWQSLSPLAISLDGNRMAAISNKDEVRLWDADTGTWNKILRVGKLESRYDNQLEFSPDGSKLAVIGKNIEIWDILNSSHLNTVELKELPGVVETLYHPISTTFSWDGTKVAMTNHRNILIGYETRLWNAATNNLLLTIDNATFLPKVKFSPDGTRLIHLAEITSRGTSSVNFVDTETGVILQTRTFSTIIEEIAFSSTGKTILAINRRGDLFIWEQVYDGKGTGVELTFPINEDIDLKGLHLNAQDHGALYRSLNFLPLAKLDAGLRVWKEMVIDQFLQYTYEDKKVPWDFKSWYDGLPGQNRLYLGEENWIKLGQEKLLLIPHWFVSFPQSGSPAWSVNPFSGQNFQYKGSYFALQNKSSSCENLIIFRIKYHLDDSSSLEINR